jgi:hypothetical protein
MQGSSFTSLSLFRAEIELLKLNCKSSAEFIFLHCAAICSYILSAKYLDVCQDI